MRFVSLLVVLLSTLPVRAAETIEYKAIGREFIHANERGKALWSGALRYAEDLLAELERALGRGLDEHERQCFLQEALKHYIPTMKDGARITGKPQGDVTPELQQYVLTKLEQVNRCSPTNRGYLAFHAWKDSGFQEPRQLPTGEPKERAAWLDALKAGVLVPTVQGVEAAAGMVPVLNPDLFTPKKPRPEDGT